MGANGHTSRSTISRDAALDSIVAAHSALAHAIAGYRYLLTASPEEPPFELIIDRDVIALTPYPGLAVGWIYTVYPDQLKERAQEVVRYTARQAIVDVYKAVWMYALSSGLDQAWRNEPVLVLLRAARVAYAHGADDWKFEASVTLPLRWRQIEIVPGMHGKSVSETIRLSEQLHLIHDALRLLDPQSPLLANVSQ